jgi:hypothetical protein
MRKRTMTGILLGLFLGLSAGSCPDEETSAPQRTFVCNQYCGGSVRGENVSVEAENRDEAEERCESRYSCSESKRCVCEG